MRKVRTLVTLLALLFCTTLLALAQSTDATVMGRVLDPTKAAVTGASVEITNVDTNVSYKGISNPAGLFSITGLPPGNYRVSVAKLGFRSIVKPDVVLHVQDVIALNFDLPVGSISEVVTVTGGAPLVNSTDASVSTVVDRNFAENLPMNGRSFQTLIELTPGVVLTPTNASDGGQFSVNGQRASSNYWMVDGVSANIGASAGVNLGNAGGPGNGMGGALGSFSASGGTNGLVSVDAMQEFRIQTSTYAPEFGRTPGGQISIVTRSGTNQFHGSLFDYLRNDVFDANDWFANSKGLPKPEERQNDFGGTFGGPVLKDRTFFFFSYEGLRLRLPQTTLSIVPDLLARQNSLPAMQPYLNAFPLPNGSDDVAAGTAEFNASYSNKSSLDAYSLRIDHKLAENLRIFGRYNYSPSEFVIRGGSNGFAALSVIQPSRITIQTVTVGATWLINAKASNDLRFNYSRTNASNDMSLDNFGGAVPLTSLPFPAPFSSRDGNFTLVISALGLNPELIVGRGGQSLQRQLNVVDNVSVQKGSHSLKFGVDFRRLSPVHAPARYLQLVAFSDVLSAKVGNADFGGSIVAANDVTLLFRDLGLFAQDTWHVVPGLTLTYGVRWDLDFVPEALSGPSIPAVTGYHISDLSQLSLAAPGTPPFKTSYGNVAPRLGLAYQISQDQDRGTVLRGGFGVFYDLVSSETGNLVGVGFPPFARFANLPAGTTFPFSSAQVAPPPIPPGGSISELYAFNPNLRLPYTLEWNVALEQGLGRQQTLSASYIGAVGRRLLQTSSFFFPTTNPSITQAFFVDNTATSGYDALQVQFERRLSHGFQALASYTWSHSIDTGSAGSPAIGSNVGMPGNGSLNRGPSDFDIRNSFSAAVTYDVPTPRFNAFTNAIFRGWSIQSIVLARSAPPVDISDFNVPFFVGGSLAEVRPDLVPGHPVYLYGSRYPGGKAFNPAAFSDPPVDTSGFFALRQGNVPRNFLRGFGSAQWDFAAHRDFPIHDSLKLQFRAELFNVLNHPNFGPPNGQFGTGAFGLSTQMLGRSLNGFGSLGAGGLDPLYQLGGPRSIQFALKLQF
jgi:hypothetical protein